MLIHIGEWRGLVSSKLVWGEEPKLVGFSGGSGEHPMPNELRK
jgi:hypothetical protein